MSSGDLALIKGQIAKLVDALRDISVDPAEIKTAVTEYLAQNPVKESDPTVPAWAKQPKKPTYTADEVGVVASSELSNAVNGALAQAKASGEFNGRDGKDDDRNEIAELAAGRVEVPDYEIKKSGNGYCVQSVGLRYLCRSAMRRR